MGTPDGIGPKDPGAAARLSERRRQAFELSKSGLSFRKIGEKLEVSHTQARKDVQYCLEEERRERQEMVQLARHMELARLNDLQAQVSAVLLTSDGPEKMAAVDRILKISLVRIRILGLDLPEDVQYSAEALAEPIRQIATVALAFVEVDKREAFMEAVEALIAGKTQTESEEKAKPDHGEDPVKLLPPPPPEDTPETDPE